MSQFLQVQGLRKSFPAGGSLLHRRRVDALKAVCFDMDRGETLGLVGESGSGKSTLGRCILGLVRPDEGAIVFDGVDVLGLSGRALTDFRRQASYSPSSRIPGAASTRAGRSAAACASRSIVFTLARRQIGSAAFRISSPASGSVRAG